MMNSKFDKAYADLVYEWRSDLIDEQNLRIAKAVKPAELFDYSGRHLELIWEATYFDDIDDVLEEWLTGVVDDFIADCRKKALAGEEYEFETHIKMSDLAKRLPLHKIKDYKNFHQFVETLKQAVGQVTVSLTDGPSCYEPPVEWIGKRIRIQDRRHDIFNEPIDEAGDLYQDYMKQLTEKKESLADKYAAIKRSICIIRDFGHVKINANYFNGKRDDFKRSAVTHEFGHLLDFLIKINAENWDIGRQYRSKTIHSDPDMTQISSIERVSYMLDETEFKRLAATYIEHLKKLHQRSGYGVEEFLEALMVVCGIPVHYRSGLNHRALAEISIQLSQHFYFSDIRDFFITTWRDSSSPQRSSARNKWTILKKWLWRELTRD